MNYYYLCSFYEKNKEYVSTSLKENKPLFKKDTIFISRSETSYENSIDRKCSVGKKI